MNLDRAFNIHGYMPVQEMTWLAEQAAKSHIIVEIGAFRGRSTRAMADNILEGGVIFTIDTWLGSQNIPSAPSRRLIEQHGHDTIKGQFMNNLQDHIDRGTVCPIEWDSQRGIPPMLESYRGMVDLLFIDGDHSRIAVHNDITNFSPLVRHGGIISGDDYLKVALSGLRKEVDTFYPQRELCGRIWYVTAQTS